MQADRARPDPRSLAGLVIPAAVEHHLVGVHVGVVVGDRHRQRVVVDLARHEVADHEAAALEHLMHGRRLVHPSGDRLEVRDVERVRVQAAVPADHIERVGRVHVPGADDLPARGPVLDQHVHIGARFADRLAGPVQVPFAVRRMLQELPVPGQVPLRRRDVRVRLDHVAAQRLRPGVSGVSGRDPPVRRRPGQDHIVARPHRQRAEHRLHGARAGLDVDAFVAGRVAVQR